MRFATAAAATFAGVVAAQNATAPVYVTDVVTAYTTFCPEATEITHAGQTYTVSQATTLTITNCPGGCTITRPAAWTGTLSAPSSPVAPVTESTSAPVAPIAYTSSSVPVAPVAPSAGVPYPSTNGTAVAPVGSGAASSTGSSSSSTASPYTGAANQAYAATGAGFLALFGLVAAL